MKLNAMALLHLHVRLDYCSSFGPPNFAKALAWPAFYELLGVAPWQRNSWHVVARDHFSLGEQCVFSCGQL
jgi:hypothetical protein